MTPLEQVTEKIIKAVPDIMELKFGCRVMYGDDTQEPRMVTIECPYYHKEENGVVKIYNPYNHDDTSDLFRVIGREINLEDVLIAGRKSKISFSVATNGEFSWYCGDSEFGDVWNPVHHSWRLGGPLHLQSPELIAWLNDILSTNLL